MRTSTLLLASALAFGALAAPVYAQHQKTAEEKAEIMAKRAAAKAAAENPEAAAEAAAPAEEAEQVATADVDTTPRTIWDGVFTQAQADAGKALYSTNCQNCHGPTGRGGPGGPGITGANLNKKWTDTSVYDLWSFAHERMPPGKAGTIGNEQDYVNVVAHILDLHGADAGESEMVYNEEQLQNITIVRKPKS